LRRGLVDFAPYSAKLRVLRQCKPARGEGSEVVDREVQFIGGPLGADGVMYFRTVEVDNEILKDQAGVEEAVHVGVRVEDQSDPARSFSSSSIELLSQQSNSVSLRFNDTGSFAR
jgi:hypothetical protein